MKSDLTNEIRSRLPVWRSACHCVVEMWQAADPSSVRDCNLAYWKEQLAALEDIEDAILEADAAAIRQAAIKGEV